MAKQLFPGKYNGELRPEYILFKETKKHIDSAYLQTSSNLSTSSHKVLAISQVHFQLKQSSRIYTLSKGKN